MNPATGTGPRVLRRYPNRLIYDTQTRQFVTLADVRNMILAREQVEIVDSKTRRSLTRGVLLQIISEQEREGHPSLLTNRVLEELVRYYGDPIAALAGPFIEEQVLTFLKRQDALRRQLARAFDAPVVTVRQLLARLRASPAAGATAELDDAAETRRRASRADRRSVSADTKTGPSRRGALRHRIP
jgi:polyhydroxyalkanoate synthesis repressor PhaR